jgi:hypothetical protein
VQLMPQRCRCNYTPHGDARLYARQSPPRSALTHYRVRPPHTPSARRYRSTSFRYYLARPWRIFRSAPWVPALIWPAPTGCFTPRRMWLF